MDPDMIVCERLAVNRKSLRIAAVTETYPPEVNGVALTVARFIEGLRDLDHEIQLIRPRQSHDRPASHEDDAEVLMRGLAIPRYPGLRMGLPARRMLTRLWSRHRPDVVHIVTEGPLGWSALQAAARLELPVTSDFRTNFDAYSGHYGIGWLKRPIGAYLRKFHNRTLVTLAPTEGLRAQLTAAGYRNVRVVARGVDTQRFHPARRSEALRRTWGAAPADLVVLYVGRIAPEKNLETLQAAFAAIQARVPRARLVLVGDGPSRLARAAGGPDIVHAGVRRDEDLAAHYASADVFLFPSLTETFGNVTVEAMASGLAVVAFDYAAAGDYLEHGVNGLLAPYGDAAAFVALAAGLVTEPERVTALGRQARASAERLDWSHAVKRMEAVLLSAAGVVGGAERVPPVSGGLEPT